MTSITELPAASKSPALRADAAMVAAWDRLMAAFCAAKAADDDVGIRHNAAYEAYDADKPAEPDIDFKLLGLQFGREMPKGERFKFLCIDNLDDWQSKIIGATGVTRWERVNRDAQRIAEIDKVREFRRLKEDSEARHDLAALDDERDATGEAFFNARNDLLLAPAPDFIAVRWKLDQLFGAEATAPQANEARSIPCWDCSLTDAVIVDMDRLNAAFAIGGAQ